MKITKKQIKELHQSGDVNKLKEWYPSVFGEVFEKDYTGWVKTKNKKNKKWLMYFKNGIQQYGIDSTGEWWIKNTIIRMEGDEIKATHQEIETALINEAKKRYKVGDKIEPLLNYYYGSNGGYNIIENLHFIFEYGFVVAIKKQNGYYLGLFKNGTWATIIKPKQMTQEEIEKELGYKIEIV